MGGGEVYKPACITSSSFFAPFYIKLDHGGGKVYKPACITSSSFFAPFYTKLDHKEELKVMPTT